MSASAEDRTPRDVLIDALDSWIRPDAAADVALAALRAAGYVVERDWQDISTAPRDGTEIDVWVGRWHDGSNFSEEAAWRMPQAYWDASMEMWCSETAHIAVPDDCATHWRPLPAPPGAAT